DQQGIDDGGRSPAGSRGEGPPPGLPLVTYSELRNDAGAVVSQVQAATASQPRLPSHIDPPPTGSGRFFTTGSKSGDLRWRVFVTNARGTSGDTLVVAVPTDEVSAALNRLTL